MDLAMATTPLMIVVSGPGGVGKGTVVELLVKRVDRLWLSKSWTTRERRPGEAEDAYRFVTREQFETRIEQGGFLEWVTFLDYLQGTPIPEPPKGNDVLLEIDVEGATQVKALFPEAVLIFVDAPSPSEQERRLNNRGDSQARIAQRLTEAERERASALSLGCEVFINDDIESTVSQLSELILAKRRALAALPDGEHGNGR